VGTENRRATAKPAPLLPKLAQTPAPKQLCPATSRLAPKNMSERTPHVLIIPSWYPATPGDVGGSFFREQAQALQRAGCKVGVIYPQLRSLRHWRTVSSGRYGITVEDDAGIETLRAHSMSWFPRMPRLMGKQWVRAAVGLYSHYVKKNGKPDLIHAHSLLYAGCAAHALSKRAHVPYVVTEHSSAYARSILGAWQRAQAAAAAKAAQRRFAVSPPFCELLTKYFGCTEGHWTPMPNIVHQDFLEIPLSKKAQVAEFSFLHVSLLDANKSVDNLIRAYAQAFSRNTNVNLIIGGDGPERLRLEVLAQELGVSGQVHFLGALSRQQVLREMQACQVFVLSSKYETFGVVVVEALALGKPVIASRCGGPESIVSEGDGILVPVDDVDNLAKAMRDMSDNYASYDSNTIRASCAARYSEHTVTNQLIMEYMAVCTGQPQNTTREL